MEDAFGGGSGGESEAFEEMDGLREVVGVFLEELVDAFAEDLDADRLAVFERGAVDLSEGCGAVGFWFEVCEEWEEAVVSESVSDAGEAHGRHLVLEGLEFLDEFGFEEVLSDGGHLSELDHDGSEVDEALLGPGAEGAVVGGGAGEAVADGELAGEVEGASAARGEHDFFLCGWRQKRHAGLRAHRGAVGAGGAGVPYGRGVSSGSVSAAV